MSLGLYPRQGVGYEFYFSQVLYLDPFHPAAALLRQTSLCGKPPQNLLHLATCPQIRKAFTPILSHLFQIQTYKPIDLLFAFPKADRCLSHLCIIAWKYILQQFCSIQSDQGIIDPETIARNTLHSNCDLLLYWATKNERAAQNNEAAGRPTQKLSQINKLTSPIFSLNTSYQLIYSPNLKNLIQTYDLRKYIHDQPSRPNSLPHIAATPS
jgi:hypothetical protein